MTGVIALILTLLLGLFILLGAFFVFMMKNSDKLVQFSIGMALGVMIILVIFDLWPEAYELLSEQTPSPFNIIIIIVAALIGMILLKVLDLFIPDHEEEKTESTSHLLHIGLVSSIAIILHNIIEGMAVYGTATSSLSLGILVSIGIGLHNLPLGMAVTSTLYRANGSRKKTLKLIGMISASTFVGGLIMFIFSGQIVNDVILGVLLSITLGMLLYIIFFELLPDIIHTKEKKLSILGVLVGIFVLLITILF